MGFITLKDGTVIHASLLPRLNEHPLQWMTVKDFEDKFISNQIDLDPDINDLVNKEFWNLI